MIETGLEKTPEKQERSDDKRIGQFLALLRALSPGDRARLKRKAGKPLNEAGDALGLFYRLLPADVPTWQEETWFEIATHFALVDESGEGNLGNALRRARGEQGAAGVDRRVEILLDSSAEQLNYRLRQTLRFLHGKEVPVNWQRLAGDLLRWDFAGKPIQKQWARSYFAAPAVV